MSRLFVFGLGYSALAVARRAAAKGWQVAGTTRDQDKAQSLKDSGIEVVMLRPEEDGRGVAAGLSGATHLLASAAPGAQGDPVLLRFRTEVESARESLAWIGYLSSLSVYGDRMGAWVEDSSQAEPTSDVGKRRLEAELAWTAFAAELNLPIAVFRLAGIYGPGRNLLRDLKLGKARCIVKPGQVFNRIHVEDIAGSVTAAMDRPTQCGIFNVADQEPAEQSKVVTEAARLLGVSPPPATPFEQAEFSPKAERFWRENRRVSAQRLRRDLDYSLRYPTYREGLAGLLSSERKSP